MLLPSSHIYIYIYMEISSLPHVWFLDYIYYRSFLNTWWVNIQKSSRSKLVDVYLMGHVKARNPCHPHVFRNNKSIGPTTGSWKMTFGNFGELRPLCLTASISTCATWICMSQVHVVQAVVPPVSMEYVVPVRLYGDGADAFSSGLICIAATILSKHEFRYCTWSSLWEC